MRISDAELEVLADEFIALQLSHKGVNLLQFIQAPQRYRAGRVDEPMKHNRFARKRFKADFRRRVQA